MSVVGYAWWLGGLVLRLLVDYWPITLTLLIATYISIARGGLPEDQQLRSLPSVLFLFPVLILLWGAVAHIEFGIRPAIPWRIAVLAVIVLLHCVMAAGVIYISRGYRRQTAWLASLITWFAFACVVQSSLALTGRLDEPVTEAQADYRP
jgi:hypothetical protein